VLVVANNVAPSSQQEISRAEFEKSIERKVDVIIPLDLKSAAQAAKLGQPLAKTAGGAKISQPLGQLVTMTVSAVDGSGDKPEEVNGDTSLLGKLGGFKSMLAKKPKADA
jgi:pilus assembly protein CpaE